MSTNRAAITALAASLATIACSGGVGAVGPSCGDTEPPPADLGRAKHVFVVTVDGLAPSLIDAEWTPWLARMAREGAASLDARTVSPSLTLPAHTSMLTGVAPDRHRVLWNKHHPQLGPVQSTTVFDLAHDAGLRTALIAGKTKLWHLIRPGGMEHGSAVQRDDEAVMDEALRVIREHRPHLALIHLPDVDNVGHRWGWNSEAQQAVAGRADAQLGRLVSTLEELGLLESSAILVTADHGGSGRSHGDGEPLDLVIPWIVWGPTIERRQLSTVCVTATAVTTARLLGLASPQAWSAPPEPLAADQP